MTQTMTPTKTRTTEEVFNSHREAIETVDLDKLAADYAEDALMITLDGSFHGREAIHRDFFQAFVAQFPDTKITYKRIAIEDDLCLMEWSAEASGMTIPVGIGALVIQDGLIQRQFEWFQLVPKEG